MGYSNVVQELISNIPEVQLFTSEEFSKEIHDIDSIIIANNLKNNLSIQPENQNNIMQNLSHFNSIVLRSQFALTISGEKEWRLDSGIALKGRVAFMRITGPEEQNFTYNAGTMNNVGLIPIENDLEKRNNNYNYKGYDLRTNDLKIKATWGWNLCGGIGVYNEDMALFMNVGFASEKNIATLFVDPYVTYEGVSGEVTSPTPIELPEYHFFRNGFMWELEFLMTLNRFADLVVSYSRIIYHNKVIGFQTEDDGEPILANSYLFTIPTTIDPENKLDNYVANYYPSSVSMQSSLERTLILFGFRFKVGVQDDY